MERRHSPVPTSILYRQFNMLADAIEREPMNIDTYRKILGLIACNIAHDTPQNAPFADYATNSESEWRYQPDEAVRNYLRNVPFIDSNDMPDEHLVEREILVTSEVIQDDMTVPLHYIVNAAGFNSWEGRRGMSSRDGDGDKTIYTPYPGFVRSLKSVDVMKHYASLTSPLPPVHTINLYVHPDSDTILGDNDSGDSHRIGAAILRGTTSVRAKNIAIQLLKPDQ